MQRINEFLYSDFIFSPQYRIWRHIFYWLFHITVWAAFWIVTGVPLSFERQILNMAMWVPCFILFSYPLVYGAIPHLLLKGKVSLFILVGLAWAFAGVYIDAGYRSFFLIPLQEAMGLDLILPRGPLPFCYLCMLTSAASPMIIKFFKLCAIKQRDWMRAEQEKLVAGLQLLKAQVHPRFLFKTLNNIYAFSLRNSPETPLLILKLSSLLSYILYDCKSEQVRLEKEIEMMKNYIDLENELHSNKVEVSWSSEGTIKDKFLSPLLLLPFLENAFKHGISEYIEKSWISVDISVKGDTLRCKIVNSKNESTSYSGDSTGITNVRKRLEYIYPGRYELKLSDETFFFVVSLIVKLDGYTHRVLETAPVAEVNPVPAYQMPMPSYR